MKKLLVVAAALLSFSMANAQMAFYLGYENISNTFKTTVANVTGTETSSTSGFNFAYTDNINLLNKSSKSLNVEVGGGLYFDFKNKNDVKYKQFGLFIPVDLNCAFELGSDLKLSIFGGPTFDLALMNKSKDNHDNEVDYFADNNVYKANRFNVYMGGGVALDFQDMLRLKIGYKWGLTNEVKECKLPLTSMESKSNMLTVSVGYLF